MKIFSIKTAKVVALLTLFVGVSLSVAHAQGGEGLTGITSFFGFGLFDFIAQGLANLMNTLMMVAGFMLALAGALLNFSINLTVHIKDFVDNTPAVFATWKAIRDISGIFIIFTLLYAAIAHIIGLHEDKWAHLVKNIVIAGIVINFSFFFAGIGIDASNVISVQLYNQIAPAQSLNKGTVSTSLFTSQNGSVTSVYGDGGLADIFMSSLKIPSLYNGSFLSGTGVITAAGKSANSGGSLNAPFKVILTGVVAVVIEITAALSFGAAAIMFIFRFVALVFLLAFSPIWFAAQIVPKIDEYAKEWTTYYFNMLTFMPAYLLLMYLALNVLTTSKLFDAASGLTSSVSSTGTWWTGYLTLGVNAAIVIILLNMPLLAAAKLSGSIGKMINTKGISADKLWGRVGGFVGTRALGAPAAKIDHYLGNTKLGNSLLARDFRSITTGAVADSKMGASRSYNERQKAGKEVARKAKEIDHAKNMDIVLNEAVTGKPHRLDDDKKPITPVSQMGNLNSKERVALIGKHLNEGFSAAFSAPIKFSG